MSCTRYDNCDLSCPPIQAVPDKSICMTKTNTLHQFDTQEVIGVPSPVGKLPILFYVRTSCDSGFKGFIYYGHKDTVCFRHPEDAHSQWCGDTYDLDYDAVEPFDNGVERGARRNFGVLRLKNSYLRRWHNGRVMYRPCKIIQGCSDPCDSYPREKKQTVSSCYRSQPAPTTPTCKSCGK